MSGTIPQGPELSIAMSFPEWQVIFAGARRGLTIETGQMVMAKFEQQIGLALQRQHANGQLPEGAQEQP